MRLSKGVHVVVDGGESWGAALTIPHDKVRVSFAVPWEGMLLLGTTDTEFSGEPDTVSVSEADVEQTAGLVRLSPTLVFEKFESRPQRQIFGFR